MLNNLESADLQAILQGCPTGLALSENNTVTWVNPTFEKYLGIQASEICGQAIAELPAVLQPLFANNETVHIPANAVHDEQWYQCQLQSVGESGHTIHFITDIGPLQILKQERELLREELREALAIDEVTGMPNKVSLFQSLEPQISRSRRYNNLLSIVIMRVNKLQSLDKAQSSSLLIAISQLLNDQVRWADSVGKLSDSDFMLILPETNAENCQKLIDNLETKLAELPLPDNLPQNYVLSTTFGCAQWEKGDDLTLLMRKARQPLMAETAS